MSKAERNETEAWGADSALAYPPRLMAKSLALATAEAKRSYSDLASSVASMSSTYTEDRGALSKLRGSATRYIGTLALYFARDFPKAISVFMELARRDLLPRSPSLRVLDLGAGLGTTSLGLARFAEFTGWCRSLAIDAVELDSGALDRMVALAEGADELVKTTITRRVASMESFLREASGPYELVLFGLSLNELFATIDERADMLARAVSLLAPGGVVVVIEPALHGTSRELMLLRDRLIGREGVAVLGPCTHDSPCPMLSAGARDWCHAELELDLPRPQAAIATRAGLRDTKPTFSWLALGRRVVRDATWVRIVSRPLGSKGKTELVACHARGLIRLRAVDRERIEPPLGGFARGDLAVLRTTEPEASSLRLGRDAVLERFEDRSLK